MPVTRNRTELGLIVIFIAGPLVLVLKTANERRTCDLRGYDTCKPLINLHNG